MHYKLPNETKINKFNMECITMSNNVNLSLKLSYRFSARFMEIKATVDRPATHTMGNM